MNTDTFAVRMGALLAWLAAFESVVDAIRTAAEGRWLLSALWLISAYGGVLIGRAVWRAAR